VAELPRGVPYIDILAPAGTAAKAEDIQTRLDLIGAAGWLVKTDDGTMERSAVPMQPLRGSTDRIQVYRQQPLMPGEPLAMGAQLAIEMAVLTEAHVAALGVYGVYAWGLVAMEDARWLYGLMLLDWIYNPRLDARGEIIESDDPALADAAVPKKVMAFAELWTPERAASLEAKLPEGALHVMDTHRVLTLLGPGGTFDPRFWQSLALQLGLDAVRDWAGVTEPGTEATTGVEDDGAGPGNPAAAAAPAPGPAAGKSPGAPVAPAAPDDGLTPLARARLEGERRAAEELASGVEHSEPDVLPDDAVSGGSVSWLETSRGVLLWIPQERFDPGWLRELRRGSTSGLALSERPGGERFEAWLAGGAPFTTELSSMAGLMAENVPLYRGSWDAAAVERDGFSTLICQLPRVSQVLGVFVPPEASSPRRILVSSDLEIPVGELVERAG
jgi:hypothetical protein